MTGLTPEGFLGKRLPQIKAELEAEFRAQFGVDLNTASETVIGQLIGIESEARADTWAALEDVYQSQYPSTASGAALDLIVALNGITRLPALPTTVTGYLSLAPGTVVSPGRKAKDGDTTYTLGSTVNSNAIAAHGAVVSVGVVSDSTEYSVFIGAVNYTYTSGTGATDQTILTGLQSVMPADVSSVLTLSDLTLFVAGPLPIVVSVNLTLVGVINVGTFTADTSGPVALPVGALNEIETPVAGWLSVTNRAAGTTGRDIESDADLRVRRTASTRLRAVSTVDGILGQLLRTNAVVDARVIENSSDTVDADGVPPQHIWCIVEGGTSAEIADVIFRRKAGGIGTFGDTSDVAFSEVTGEPYLVNFGRPSVIPAYVVVNVSASGSIPADYIARVRTAIVAYSDTQKIGERLILNRLFTPASLALDELSFVSSIKIGLSPSPSGQSNLIAGTDERFQIAAGNIDVLLD